MSKQKLSDYCDRQDRRKSHSKTGGDFRTMTTQLSHDAFARESLLRDSVETTKSCDWCGGKRKGGKLFAYRIETDNYRSSPIKGLFCSVNCMRTYHHG